MSEACNQICHISTVLHCRIICSDFFLIETDSRPDHLFIFKYIFIWTTACSSFTLLYPILKTNKVLKSILRRLPRSHGTHCRSSDQRRIQGGAQSVFLSTYHSILIIASRKHLFLIILFFRFQGCAAGWSYPSCLLWSGEMSFQKYCTYCRIIHVLCEAGLIRHPSNTNIKRVIWLCVFLKKKTHLSSTNKNTTTKSYIQVRSWWPYLHTM